MALAERLKVWAQQIRAPFLLLSVVLPPVGALAAWWETGELYPERLLLTWLGLILAHISVNLLNEYFDYRSGVDLRTRRTPFSGGSGVLPRGLLRPQTVWRAGMGALLGAFAVGLYLTVIAGPMLLLLIFAGGAIVYFYTPWFACRRLGELAAGLGLGSLPVLGAYFIQTGQLSLVAGVAALPPGFLTANLLLLNELPDVEADQAGGRDNLVIWLGRRRAVWVYILLLLLCYLSILGGVAGGALPLGALLGLVSLPLAWITARGALAHHEQLTELVPALATNVQVVLGTDLLLAGGFLLAGLLRW